MPIAIAAGYLGGALLTYFGGRWIIQALGGRLTLGAPRQNLPGILGTAGGLLALLPAMFLGTVVGSLGGAYGEAVSQAIGLGQAGVPIGLAIAIALATGLVACVGVLLGASVGKLFNATRSAT